jgi:IS30 family transposase
MSARIQMKRPTTATAREIAAAIGKSVRTIQRHMAQPRAEYEANSISKAKPWESQGISRATWYRRQACKDESGKESK